MKCGHTAFETRQVPRAKARVLVIGAGGLGSPALMSLGRSGVAVIGVADGDTVDVTNLHRQIIHTTAGQGARKVDSAGLYLRQAGYAGKIEKHPFRLGPDRIVDVVSGYDVVVDASDTFRSKFMVNDACVIAGVPYVHSGVLRFEGQLLTVIPGKSPCLRCLFESPPPPGTVKTCREVGVLGAAAGVLGCIQVAEALKVVDGTGLLMAGRVLFVNMKGVEFRQMPLVRDPSCAVCGDAPAIKSIEERNYPA
ncbi:MAG: HesA/MoeB/ThiF family protein [Myxococcota bacterium]